MLLARLVVGVAVAGSAACAASEMSYDPSDPGPPGVKTPRPGSAEACRDRHDRPAPGKAAVVELAEEDVILVRYSATPDEEPCETLDILFRKRGEMLVGEPGHQIELVWTGERAVSRVGEVRLVVKDAALAVPSVLERRGSRRRISSYLPPAILARYGRDDRPALEFATHRIKLSSFQIGMLQRFAGLLPFHDAFAAPSSHPSTAPAPARAEDGSGWFCVEAEKPGRRKRVSSCHRTAAACDEARAAMIAEHGQAGECISSRAASCYGWRTGAREERSCFYRPAHCKDERLRRQEEHTGVLLIGGCAPSP